MPHILNQNISTSRINLTKYQRRAYFDKESPPSIIKNRKQKQENITIVDVITGRSFDERRQGIPSVKEGV